MPRRRIEAGRRTSARPNHRPCAEALTVATMGFVVPLANQAGSASKRRRFDRATVVWWPISQGDRASLGFARQAAARRARAGESPLRRARRTRGPATWYPRRLLSDVVLIARAAHGLRPIEFLPRARRSRLSVPARR